MLLFENLVLDDCLVQAIEEGEISIDSLKKISLANRVKGTNHIKVTVTLNDRQNWRTLYKRDFKKVKGNYSYTAAGELKVYVITSSYLKDNNCSFKPFLSSKGNETNHVAIDTFIDRRYGFHSSILSLI